MNDDELYGKVQFWESSEEYTMPKLTAGQRDDLVRETHQALLGIPGTEDKGVVGDIKEIKSHLDDHSFRLRTVEVRQQERTKPSKKSIVGYLSGVVAIAIALWKSFYGG